MSASSMVQGPHMNALIAISDEHAHLIALMAELDRIAAQEPADPGEAVKAVDDLLEATEAHFIHEEELMIGAGYPHYAGHKANHEQILASIRKLVDRFRAGEIDSAARIKDAIKEWMLVHMEEFDRTLITLLSEKI